VSLRTRRLVAVATAVAFGTADLVQKAAAGPSLQHARPAEVLALMALVLLVLVVLVPRIPWLPVAFGAGIAAGGTVGNLASLLIWRDGVPDPLVVHSASGAIAFNLADVFVLCGDALLLCAAAVYALRNRDRLRLPV
jgi:lipoprotein signal peptidase